MSQPFIGEIRMFGGSFPPQGWAFCSGQNLPISENETLFQLIGTTYGGDGQSTFALPNLESRVPVHQGTSSGSGSTYQLGETGGVESVTLTVQQIPTHTHTMIASADPSNQRGGGNAVLGRGAGAAYASEYDPQVLSPQSVTPVGGSQPHENMQPFLVISFIISLFGIFPNPN